MYHYRAPFVSQPRVLLSAESENQMTNVWRHNVFRVIEAIVTSHAYYYVTLHLRAA